MKAFNGATEQNAYDKLLHDMHSDPNLTPEKLEEGLQEIAQNGHADAFLQIARLHLSRALVNHNKEKGIEALVGAAVNATIFETRADALNQLITIKNRIIERNDIRSQGDAADLVDIAYANKKAEQDAKVLPVIDGILEKYDHEMTPDAQDIPFDSIEN
ncbi:MAG: hypothetical protein ACRBDI_05925 [Alphaproteobacteria bacterium]